MIGKDSMSTINIAIVGAGSEGIQIVSALNECPATNVVGFCDPNLNSSSTVIAQELSVPLFDKIEQLPSIGDVDLIIDISDDGIEIEGIDGLNQVEVLRGKSVTAIKGFIAGRKSHDEGVDAILAASTDFASQNDGQEIYRSIVENALKITGCAAGSLIIFDEKTQFCRLAESVGYSGKEDTCTWELPLGGITEQLLDIEDPIFIQDITKEPHFDNPVMNEGTISVLAAPLRGTDEIIGLLFVGDFKPRQFSEREISLYSTYANQASLALQKAILTEEIAELSSIDCLTGLSNNRHFITALDMEAERAKRFNSHFSVLLMELDNLDYVNDYFGYNKGDWALRKVAEIIRTCSRQVDYKARYGGDEFAMILPNTSCDRASVVANRIRRQVNDIFIEEGDKEVRLSMSIGIAEFPCLGTDRDNLLNAVATALFICKQRGRNLVCCYEGGDEEPQD